jgi:hypothetical protein
MTEVAAFTAWLGAAALTVSDGRRGLALGLALTTAAFAVLVSAGGQPVAAAVLLLGGAVAAIRRLRTGPQGWAMMPPGSTPRLVLSIAAGLVALWIATTVMTGAGGQLRFAALTVLGMMGARLLAETSPAAILTALASLAMAIALATGIADSSAGPVPYLAAAAIAVIVSVVNVAEPDGA